MARSLRGAHGVQSGLRFTALVSVVCQCSSKLNEDTSSNGQAHSYGNIHIMVQRRAPKVFFFIVGFCFFALPYCICYSCLSIHFCLVNRMAVGTATGTGNKYVFTPWPWKPSSLSIVCVFERLLSKRTIASCSRR